jgi:hypothetical protein
MYVYLRDYKATTETIGIPQNYKDTTGKERMPQEKQGCHKEKREIAKYRDTTGAIRIPQGV